MTRANWQFSRQFIICELARELYRNPAISGVCNEDKIVVPEDNLVAFLHDMDVVFSRVLRGSARKYEE